MLVARGFQSFAFLGKINSKHFQILWELPISETFVGGSRLRPYKENNHQRLRSFHGSHGFTE